MTPFLVHKLPGYHIRVTECSVEVTGSISRKLKRFIARKTMTRVEMRRRKIIVYNADSTRVISIIMEFLRQYPHFTAAPSSG